VDRFLIVGLGNPGRGYGDSRHNIGFRCVSELARAHGLTFSRRQNKALVADGRIAERKVLLAKPQTFMNASGQSVAGLVRFYRFPLARVLVIFDDLDLPLGTLRIRKGGGAGGHKGMRDIIQRLGADTFPRLRVGIGRPPGRMDPIDYVLQDFGKDELSLVREVCERTMRAVETWLAEGLEIAMTRHNGPEARPPEGARGDGGTHRASDVGGDPPTKVGG
jgi:PTH1 family peptidyl-tRNA hydrolase